MRDHFISINGLRLHYLEWGEKPDPPLLLLHGGTAHAYWWSPFADALGEGHRILALDLRGHGDSDWADPPRYDLETHAADVGAFVEALGLKALTVMGHSYGGLVAMQHAGKLGERLARLIIVDIRPRLTKRGARYLRAIRVLPNPTYSSLEEAVERFQLLPRANGTRPTLLAQVARRAFRQLEDGTWTAKFDRRSLGEAGASDLTSQIGALRCPLLFIRGEKSEAVSSAGVAEIEAAAPKARIVTINDAHHHVMLDQPEALAEAVRNFILTR